MTKRSIYDRGPDWSPADVAMMEILPPLFRQAFANGIKTLVALGHIDLTNKDPMKTPNKKAMLAAMYETMFSLYTLDGREPGDMEVKRLKMDEVLISFINEGFFTTEAADDKAVRSREQIKGGREPT